jgi:hypothetical protein
MWLIEQVPPAIGWSRAPSRLEVRQKSPRIALFVGWLMLFFSAKFKFRQVLPARFWWRGCFTPCRPRCVPASSLPAYAATPLSLIVLLRGWPPPVCRGVWLHGSRRHCRSCRPRCDWMDMFRRPWVATAGRVCSARSPIHAFKHPCACALLRFAHAASCEPARRRPCGAPVGTPRVLNRCGLAPAQRGSRWGASPAVTPTAAFEAGLSR